MKIGKKLGAGFGIIVLIILLATTWSRMQLSSIQDDYTDLLETNVALSMLSKKVETESALQGQFIRSYLLQGKSADLEQFKERHDNMNAALESMATLAVTDEMKEKVANTQQLSKEYYAASEELIALRQSDDLEEATSFLVSGVTPINITIRETTAEMADYQNNLLAKGNANVQRTADRAQVYSILAGVLSLVLSVIIAIYLTRSISRPLKRLSAAVTVVANGDLTEDDVTVNTKDEVAELADSFNIMKTNLRELISGVNSNSLHLTASAEELSASTYEVSQSAEDMAKSIESVAQGAQVSASAAGESSIAMEETAVGVQRIAESAVELNTSAEETMRIANESGKTIETAKSQMDLIYQTSHETSSLIQRLSRQTEEIESITSVITGITEQTNLLALNAAIEAARAGEHGKGFAVVADEVRKLAEESKKSAGQIVQLTMAIQSDTKDVEQSVTESMQNVEQGVAVIDNAGRTFVEIVKAVQTMTNQITEISAATEQISASAEEVSASVSEISGQAASASIQTEQNSASMEEQMATIEEINAVAQDLSVKAVELQEMIQQFTV